MASAEEGPEPLKYQTLTLKVSIHCEGCKKKVKKLLQSIEGVYKTTIDSQQQKVVVTGNVEAETLIKKLLKNGKHAELWPEKKPNDPANNNSGGGGGGGGGGKKNKKKNKASGKPNESSENPDTNETPKTAGEDSSPDSSAQPDGKAPMNGGKDFPEADKKEAGNSPPPEKKDGAAAATSSGGGGKKKGKKGQKEHNGGGGGGEGQVVSEDMGCKPSGGLPAFNCPVYPASQPLAYVVSYSSVQPSASYGGAYHPISMNQSCYCYSGATAATAPCSYYIFSDENANACRIM